MKILRVGDPHVKPSNIHEWTRIMHEVLYLAELHKVDRIEILGDLFHTHAVMRVEVLEFWTKWLNILPKRHEVVVLVGNHDMAGDHNSESHALSVFHHLKNDNLKIIDVPTSIGIYAYVPYYHSHEHFLTSAGYLATHDLSRVLVCHQTISGSQYENGFYAPDGVDPARIPFGLIISGHIHKRQTIVAGEKTVIYPGTARWDSLSDANEDKGLWIYEHNDNTGEIISSEFFSNKHICVPIVQISWTQGENMPELPAGNISLNIELIGTSDWIKEQKERLKGKASIKAKITDTKSASRKAGDSLHGFVRDIYKPETVEREELLEFMIGEKLV